MRAFIKLTVIILFNTQLLYADAGNCVKYFVRIHLDKDQINTGYLYIGSYDPKFVFKDTTFFDYIKSLLRDTIILYKEIKELAFPIYHYSYKCNNHFIAIPERAIIKFTPKQIKQIDLLGYSGCDKCSNDFYYSGVPLIFELNDYEINLLNTKPISDSSFTYNAPFNPNLIWIISYNKDYGLDKINDIWIKYKKLVQPFIDKEDWRPVNKYYLDLKTNLRKLNIIIFEIQFSL